MLFEVEMSQAQINKIKVMIDLMLKANGLAAINDCVEIYNLLSCAKQKPSAPIPEYGHGNINEKE